MPVKGAVLMVIVANKPAAITPPSVPIIAVKLLKFAPDIIKIVPQVAMKQINMVINRGGAPFKIFGIKK